MGNAFLQCGIICVVVLVGCSSVFSDRGNGTTYTQYQTGVLMFSIIVVTVHVHIATYIMQWTIGHILAVWGSIGERLLVWLRLLVARCFVFAIDSTVLKYFAGTNRVLAKTIRAVALTEPEVLEV